MVGIEIDRCSYVPPPKQRLASNVDDMQENKKAIKNYILLYAIK